MLLSRPSPIDPYLICMGYTLGIRIFLKILGDSNVQQFENHCSRVTAQVILIFVQPEAFAKMQILILWVQGVCVQILIIYISNQLPGNVDGILFLLYLLHNTKLQAQVPVDAN